jgi:hypothetical protein
MIKKIIDEVLSAVKAFPVQCDTYDVPGQEAEKLFSRMRLIS